MPTILIVDDESGIRKSIRFGLKRSGYEIIEAACASEAVDLINNNHVDIILSDMRMPQYPDGDIDDKCGLNLLKKVKKISPNSYIIVMTAHGSIENAVEVMKEGAFDYLPKPFSMDELRIKVDKALAQMKIVNENKYLREQMKNYEGTIIGNSEAIKDVWKSIHDVAKTNVPVFINGESGVGKELVARAIHNNSQRKNNVFMAVNLGAIPGNLIESELFGHEKGAFTDAVAQRIGRFEAADGGSLFLDEIGEIDMNLHVKLLRVLQEQCFERIGGNTTIKTNVRIIAATNSKLEDKIREGKFREDLFFRINVFPIHVPPLRQRKEDISELVDHFINKYEQGLSKAFKGITPNALTALMESNWPGNIRELENVVQRMMIKGKGDYLDVKDIPGEITTLSSANFEGIVDTLFDVFNPEDGKSLWNTTMDTLAAIAFKRTKKKHAAAQLLGISKPTLYHWLKSVEG
ncbi:MAG: sigma-54 dependent transcriptional regulator [bacterium]|nr:sigma-54 dependent transcriptional regulator [bacterium]